MSAPLNKKPTPTASASAKAKVTKPATAKATVKLTPSAASTAATSNAKKEITKLVTTGDKKISASEWKAVYNKLGKTMGSNEAARFLQQVKPGAARFRNDAATNNQIKAIDARATNSKDGAKIDARKEINNLIANGDNKISASEWKAVYNKLGATVGSDEAARVLQQIKPGAAHFRNDEATNNQIKAIDARVTNAQNVAKANAQSEIKKLTTKDKVSDGKISADEWQAVYNKLGKTLGSDKAAQFLHQVKPGAGRFLNDEATKNQVKAIETRFDNVKSTARIDAKKEVERLISDGDKKISAAEWKAVYNKLGATVGSDEAARVLQHMKPASTFFANEAAKNQVKAIDARVTRAQNVAKANARNEIKNLIDNGDGKISSSEWQKVYNDLGKTISSNEAAKFLQQIKPGTAHFATDGRTKKEVAAIDARADMAKLAANGLTEDEKKTVRDTLAKKVGDDTFADQVINSLKMNTVGVSMERKVDETVGSLLNNGKGMDLKTTGGALSAGSTGLGIISRFTPDNQTKSNVDTAKLLLDGTSLLDAFMKNSGAARLGPITGATSLAADGINKNLPDGPLKDFVSTLKNGIDAAGPVLGSIMTAPKGPVIVLPYNPLSFAPEGSVSGTA
jgi:Ca2+-binding EF-hand superfamily protein